MAPPRRRSVRRTLAPSNGPYVPFGADTDVSGVINILDVGGVSDATHDSSGAIIDALATGKTVLIPRGATIGASVVDFPSAGGLLIVDGTLVKVNSSPGAILRANGLADITVRGRGTIDGNKGGQSAVGDVAVGQNSPAPIVAHEGLLDFNNCADLTIAVRQVKDFYFPTATDSNLTAGTIFVRNSSHVTTRVDKVTNYAREGIWLFNCDDSQLLGGRTMGGVDSWSGCQVYGTRNLVDGFKSYDAGASAIGVDSSYSRVANCLAYNYVYFNGFNFGHPTTVTGHTLVENCHAFLDAGVNLTNIATDTADGFHLNTPGTNMMFVNCITDGAARHGFKVSSGCKDIFLALCQSTNSTGTGLSFDGDTYWFGCNFEGNTQGNIQVNAGANWVSLASKMTSTFRHVMDGNKLSAFGIGGIVQPTGTPAAATDEATTLDLANYLRTKLLALGWIAS